MTKLTKKQSQDLRWGTWPYSEIKVITETRILDDKVSRTMKYIEIAINPLTFDIVSQNVDRFDKKFGIQWMLDYAENRWGDGYIVRVSPEMEREKWMTDIEEEIEGYRKNAEQLLIEMHTFVMYILDIEKS